MDKVIDYIKALVNLYGLVHKNQVVEIYNMQNEIPINNDTMLSIIKDKKQLLLDEYYVYIKNDYFIYLGIMVSDAFKKDLKAKKGKPFYIPDKEELLRYKDVTYFEINKEYEELLEFLEKMFWRKSKSKDVCREIHNYCKSSRAMENISMLFEEKRIRIKNTKQLEELMNHIRNLVNNTRIWQNNGYTPNELSEIMEEQHM